MSAAAAAQREQTEAVRQALYQQQMETIRLQAKAAVEGEYYKTHRPILVETIPAYKVSDVSSDGARIYVGEKDYFVYDLTGVLSDRTYDGLQVVSAATYTYTTVNGASRRIPAYRVLTPAEKAQQQELEVLINQAAIKLYNEAQVRSTELKQTASIAAAKRTFAFRKEQADKDSPSALYQYLVGKMYLNGEGTEVNTKLGLEYIYKASTNGSQDAVDFLKKR